MKNSARGDSSTGSELKTVEEACREASRTVEPCVLCTSAVNRAFVLWLRRSRASFVVQFAPKKFTPPPSVSYTCRSGRRCCIWPDGRKSSAHPGCWRPRLSTP
jgi:hypothetical protein